MLFPGWTPLVYAAKDNRLESAELLLDRGADTMMRDKEGKMSQYIVNRRNNLIDQLVVL